MSVARPSVIVDVAIASAADCVGSRVRNPKISPSGHWALKTTINAPREARFKLVRRHSSSRITLTSGERGSSARSASSRPKGHRAEPGAQRRPRSDVCEVPPESTQERGCGAAYGLEWPGQSLTLMGS